MSTKNNPGPYDCLSNADPDEPYFLLLGRDKHAAALVRLWAELREREGEPPEVVAEARKCADELEAEAVKRGKPVLSLDALLSFVTMMKGMRQHDAEVRAKPAEVSETEWRVGEPAMTIHGRDIGNVEGVVEAVEGKHGRMINVRFGPQHMASIPLANVRKPTTQELETYYVRRAR